MLRQQDTKKTNRNTSEKTIESILRLAEFKITQILFYLLGFKYLISKISILMLAKNNPDQYLSNKQKLNYITRV